MSDTPETDTAIKAQSEWKLPFVSYTMGGVTYDGPVATLCRKLERERDEAREELHKASVEANALATSIQKAEYFDAKEFELLGSVAGVISQIDNMYAGVRQQRDEALEELIHLRSCVYDVIHSLKAGAFDELEKAWKKGLK